ncbi:MAG: histidine kinase [bacterium]|nr:histidine kinase [bacterium]
MSVFVKILGWLVVNTTLGIMNALLISFYSPEPLPRVFLTAQLNTHTICTLIEVAIYTLGIRLYESGRRQGRPVSAFFLVLALAMFAGLIGVYLGALLSRSLLDFDPLAHGEQQFFSVIYGSILVAIIITAIDRWVRQMNQRKLQLETALQEARLKSLQYRMRPHFLFNTLNTIHSTLRRDVAKADQALMMLAANYRFILETAENTLIDFAEEWEFTRSYIELEHLRFSDRLTLRLDSGVENKTTDESETDAGAGLAKKYAGVRVPPLSIQPLVENAFIHGVRRLRENGLIEVSARRDGDWVHVIVRDNGPGEDWPENRDPTALLRGEGTLPHIKERIQYYYPRRSDLIIRRRAPDELPDWPNGCTEFHLSFDSQALHSRL